MRSWTAEKLGSQEAGQLRSWAAEKLDRREPLFPRPVGFIWSLKQAACLENVP
jgi:hypothetical protein